MVLMDMVTRFVSLAILGLFFSIIVVSSLSSVRFLLLSYSLGWFKVVLFIHFLRAQDLGSSRLVQVIVMEELVFTLG